MSGPKYCGITRRVQLISGDIYPKYRAIIIDRILSRILCCV